jgi:hypothetical protein
MSLPPAISRDGLIAFDPSGSARLNGGLVASWLSFYKWTLIDADKMRRRRATRPRWRQLLRPLGGDAVVGRHCARLDAFRL